MPRCEPFHASALGFAPGVRKPERGAVVMRDGEAKALRRESQSADGRGQVERLFGALAGAHEGLLAGRPGERTAGADRHVIDPPALAVGRNHLAFALRVARHHLAVIAAGDHALGIRARAENRAAVHRNPARLAAAWHENQRLLAEHQDRGLAEKMRRHDRRAGRHRPRALDHRGDVALGVTHRGGTSLVSWASAARCRVGKIAFRIASAWAKALRDFAHAQRRGPRLCPPYARCGALAMRPREGGHRCHESELALTPRSSRTLPGSSPPAACVR